MKNNEIDKRDVDKSTNKRRNNAKTREGFRWKHCIIW